MKILIVLLVVCGCVTSELSNEDITHINNGLESAKALGEFLEKGDFFESITQLGKTIGPYLSAVGPIVGLLLGLFGSHESAELAYLKLMMKHIDNRFDRLEEKFEDINRKIDYVHIQIDYGTIAQNIRALSAEFEKLYNSHHAVAVQQKSVFIKYYESNFQLSGQKLYDGIISHENSLIKNLGEAAMEYSQNDRASTQQFLMGILKLLLQAVKLELAYLKAKGPHFHALLNATNIEWQQKISEVKDRMIMIDNTVVSRYKNQSEVDVEHFATNNVGLHNIDFSKNLYNFLVSKYYWRDWLVISYNEISVFDNHCLTACDGFARFRYHGRNLALITLLR